MASPSASRRRSTLACLFAVGLSPAAPLACTAAQLRADAPAIEGIFAALCPLESMIPIEGPVAAAACPSEEKALASILAGPKPPTPAPTPVPVFRRAASGGLVHCGTLAPVAVADGGAPKPDGGR